MQWNRNGIIIQGLYATPDLQTDLPYCGLERYVSWPLSEHADPVSRNLTTEAHERWFDYYNENKFALEVVPDKDYIERYITACRCNNVEIRILFVETDRDNPKWHAPVPKGTFLVCDYATSQDFFSALYIYMEQIHLKYC